MPASAFPGASDDRRADSSDADWSEIEQSLAEIADLSQSKDSFPSFAAAALLRLIPVLNADWGAVWLRGGNSELHLVCQQGRHSGSSSGPDAVSDPSDPSRDSLAGSSPSEHGGRLERAQLLRQVIETAQPRIGTLRGTGPSAIVSKPDEVTTATLGDWTEIVCPFEVDGSVAGLIEVLHEQPIDAETRRGNVRYLEMVCQLVADFFGLQQLRDLRSADHLWRQYETMSRRVHGSLELESTAAHLVNDGRQFIGCDRLTLLVIRSQDPRVLAVSGLDLVETRAQQVTAMERLAVAVMRTGDWFRYRGETDALPPQLEQPWREYADLSHAIALDAVPIFRHIDADTPEEADNDSRGDRVPVALLVAEQFGGESAIHEGRLMQVAGLASTSLTNALNFRSLPLLGLSRWLGRTRTWGRLHRHRLLLAVAGLAAIGLALTLIRAPFKVAAAGTLQPQLRRELFAPLDGEVIEVRVDHGDPVNQDQVLVSMRSRDLEQRLQQLQGEYQTTEKKLAAIRSARVQVDATRAGQREGASEAQLAAEEQELEQLLESLRLQLDLVRGQQSLLQVRSPLTGRVVTWNPRQSLEDRPVQRGQRLLTTADFDGPWELELSVPDNQVGYVISARATSDAGLDLQFSPATDRGRTFSGRVTRIAARSETLEDGQSAVRVTASVPDLPAELLRPGATIYAKIDCGRRSLGFVWLHDVFNAVRGWWSF